MTYSLTNSYIQAARATGMCRAEGLTFPRMSQVSAQAANREEPCSKLAESKSNHIGPSPRHLGSALAVGRLDTPGGGG